MANYTLYGAEFSLYSGKIRSYLRYKRLDYAEVFSSISIYKKIIVPNTGVKFIPVVKTPKGDYLQDTSVIIDRIEQDEPQRSVIPSGNKQHLVALLLELYGDEWLLIPAMHYRWNYDNFPFVYQEFGGIVAPKMPAFIRAFIGKRIGAPFKKVVPKLGITAKSIPAIEHWYEKEFLADLNRHFEQHDFLLGGRPCIGDFGFFGPLYAHLYRDPCSGQLMKKIAPNVVAWVERMQDASNVQGDFLADDAIPDSLLPILRHLFKHQWPMLQHTSERLSEWADQQDESDGQEAAIPRRLGMQPFTIGEIEEQRLVMPYSLWMMQRPLDFYQSLETEQQQSMSELLSQLDAKQALDFTLKSRVTRHNNQFVVEQ